MEEVAGWRFSPQRWRLHRGATGLASQPIAVTLRVRVRPLAGDDPCVRPDRCLSTDPRPPVLPTPLYHHDRPRSTSETLTSYASRGHDEGNLSGGGARTAIGAFAGAYAEVPAPALGSTVIKAALQRAQVPHSEVDEVIFGNVIGAGLGQNVARQAAIGAGLSVNVGATTINKVCGSGLKSVMLAAQAIQCGDADVVVAGGTENMTRVPFLLDKARAGYRLGDGTLVDALIRDGLWDVYNNLHMGTCGDQCAAKYGFTRAQQDDYAVASYRRAIRPRKHARSAGRSPRSRSPAERARSWWTGTRGRRDSTKRSCGP